MVTVNLGKKQADKWKFNSLPAKCFVGFPQPAERQLVLAVQTVMEVEQRVVRLHKLVQGMHQVSAKE